MERDVEVAEIQWVTEELKAQGAGHRAKGRSKPDSSDPFSLKPSAISRFINDNNNQTVLCLKYLLLTTNEPSETP